MEVGTWISFLVASVVISLTPGAGAVASMASGARHGWRGGLWTVAGLQLGVLLHLGLVAAGLGAVIVSSPRAFAALQVAGCVYLAWLGLRMIFRPAPAASVDEGRAAPPMARLVHGFLVNATNPKAIVFLLAVLPPFLDPARPLAPQYGAMALTLVAVDLAVMAGLYTWAGSRLLATLTTGSRRRWVDVGFGVVFLVAAALLATFRR